MQRRNKGRDRHRRQVVSQEVVRVVIFVTLRLKKNLALDCLATIMEVWIICACNDQGTNIRCSIGVRW